MWCDNIYGQSPMIYVYIGVMREILHSVYNSQGLLRMNVTSLQKPKMPDGRRLSHATFNVNGDVTCLQLFVNTFGRVTGVYTACLRSGGGAAYLRQTGNRGEQ